MNILLTKKEQDLLFLLEELTKNHDWIEIPVLAENLKLAVKELQEHLSSLEQLFPNLLIQSRKKAFNCSLTFKTPWILGLQSLNNLQPTLF
ncbi:helix-turn-helix domain-containing protein [Streptococcus mitis]|uniref:helix-turn-helix domain-containing protein n=1 Tax=Streptococcus mitis TaxID=28037 RepID=UPI0039C16342